MFCFVIRLDDNEGFQTACMGTVKLSNLHSICQVQLSVDRTKNYLIKAMIIFANIYTIITLVLTICFYKKFPSKSFVDITKILYVMYNRKYK